MKRILHALCVLWLGCLLGTLPVRAAGGEWLERLQAAVHALERYEVQFDLSTTDGYTASGSCRIAGEHYLIALPGMQVFCDGSTRYEVNDRTQEVVIDTVHAASKNLLDNPVRAFDFVGEQYAVEQTAATAEHVTLRLTPRSGSGAGTEGAIVLILDRRSALPVEVVYAAGDLQLAVKIRRFEKSTEPLPAFRKADFPDYEWIDFR